MHASIRSTNHYRRVWGHVSLQTPTPPRKFSIFTFSEVESNVILESNYGPRNSADKVEVRSTYPFEGRLVN